MAILKNIKRIILSFDFVRILLVILALGLIFFQQTSSTFAKYSSALSSVAKTARVAKWDVDAKLDVTSVSVTYGSWSSPIKLTITNNSEVLACYGKIDENDKLVFNSVVTLSDLSTKISLVRVFDPQIGDVVTSGNQFINNTIAISFYGTLEPGEERLYYIQMYCSSAGSNEAQSMEIQADCNFRFEQALNTTAASASFQ